MKTLVTLCLCFGAFFCEKRNSSRINLWADSFIEDVTHKLRSTDREFVPVPDFREETVEHSGKVPVKHGVLAVDGVFGELSSMKRNSDMSILQHDGLTKIELPVTLLKAGVHFDKAFIWCGSTETLDELEVKVPIYGKMNLRIKFTLKPEQNLCRPVLDGIEMKKFENVDVILSEVCLSKLNEVSDWAIKYFNSKLNQTLTTTLSKVITERLITHRPNICTLLQTATK